MLPGGGGGAGADGTYIPSAAPGFVISDAGIKFLNTKSALIRWTAQSHVGPRGV